MSNFGGGNSGGGQQTTMIVVAMCCFSSLAVGLFLWWAYNNQSSVPWLDWFYKLFNKGEDPPVDDGTNTDAQNGTYGLFGTDTPIPEYPPGIPTDTPTPTTTTPTTITPTTKPVCKKKSKGELACRPDKAKCPFEKGYVCASSCSKCRQFGGKGKPYYKRKKEPKADGCFEWDNQAWKDKDCKVKWTKSKSVKGKSGYAPMAANEFV